MVLGHKIVSNGMILQRGEDFILTGTAKEGTEVEVRFAGDVRKCLCMENSWSVCFEHINTGGPYVLTISCNGETQEVSDILIGDVYFMSGQSNMELDIDWVYHSFKEEIDAFDCDAIRQFKVPTDYDFNAPLEDVADGKWVKAKKDDKRSFGAIGFFMAKYLHERNGVPIGLIQTAVKGCPIESFLSKENVSLYQSIQLEEICFHKDYMNALIKKELIDWQARVDELMQLDQKMEKEPWKRTVIPLLWESEENQAGIYTFSKIVKLDTPPTEDAVLKLGLLIEADYTYVNGILVGQTDYQYPPRRYLVPKELLHEGDNEITVKVVVTNGICRFWEKSEYTLQIQDRIYDLTGVWHYRKGPFFREGFFTKTFYEYLPYGVYNAMLAPLMDYKVKALLWYQGESNAKNPKKYYEKFRTLVEQFRIQMHNANLPVYYVQIAYYEDPTDIGGIGWETIRLEQEKAQTIDNVYMVLSGDVGSATDLHPQNKKAIGERIAELILK